MRYLILLLLCWQAGHAQTVSLRKVHIQPGNGVTGTAYDVKALRSLGTYPLNSTGQKNWENAIASGQISLTVISNGCVVAPGTIPPPTLPTCTGTAPSWLALRYSYMPPLLTFEAQDGAGKLQFDRLDGSSFSTTNPDGVLIASGQLYAPGPNADLIFTKRWQLNYIGSALRITAQQANASAVYSYSLTPVAGANKVLLTSGATTPPGSTTQPPANTVPSTLAGGYGEGTASGLFAYAPFVPSTNQFSTWPYGGANRQYLQNQYIRAGFMKGLGGTLDYLSEINGPNLLNNNASGGAVVEGQTVPENGRQAGVAPYATPIPYSQDGQVSGPIGWNGVVGGSKYQDKSLILHFERKTVTGYGEVLYFKTQPQQWEMHNILTKSYVHSFYWLEGRTIRYFYILENFRDDNTMTFDGRGQELPFAYVTAPHYRYFVYTGNSPGTNGALTQINKPQPVEGGGNDNQNDTGEYNSTENWIGAVNTSNQGLFIVTPYNSRFNGKQFQSWYGDETTNASAYIGAVSTINFDLPGTAQAFSGYMYVGGMSDFRTWYNSASITGRPFSFSFTAHKTAGWYGAAKFNSSDRYEFNIGRKHDGNPNSNFHSPWGVWQASNMPTLYIKGKFSGVSSISLEWTRPNETDIQSAANQKTVSVINDGAEHTYTITMSGSPNWSGIITRLKIGNPYNYSTNTFPSVPDNATFIPTYIGTQSPD